MLTKKEWIAVVIVLIIAAVFLGPKLIIHKAVPDVIKSVDTIMATTTTTNTNNNNMNTNNGGLIIKDSIIGSGAEAKAGNLVSVQYTGRFADGKVFDSSIPRGQPIEFTLGAGQVIKGWDQGILGMKVGGKRSLTIPASLGYGANGYPPVIPANATLYFDVELVGVKTQ
jgi:FKBP-type peptidyl-prolyl cis-trans isomerase